MAEKLLQARVDERTAMRLWAYAEAMPGEPGKTNKSNKKKKMSESELVKHAIDLVIAESDRQLVALQRKIRADAEQTAQALSGDMPAPSRPASALQLGAQVLLAVKPSRPRFLRPKRIGCTPSVEPTALPTPS